MQAQFTGDFLTNIHTKWVLMLVGVLLVLRMSMMRSRPATHQPADSAAEFMESALIAVVLVFLVIRPFVVQAFFIPSGSMRPTLIEGDRILVNKFLYRFRPPARGDVVVFLAPEKAARAENGEAKDFIKRIVGLPGDRLEVVPDRILVDGKIAVRLVSGNNSVSDFPPDSTLPPTLEMGGPYHRPVMRGAAAVVEPESGSREALRVIATPKFDVQLRGGRVFIDGKEYQYLSSTWGEPQVEESVVGYGGDPNLQARVFRVDNEPRLIVVKGRKVTADPAHLVVNGKATYERYIQERPEYVMAPYKVPAGHYFVMGDNRNDSNDSHQWGPLEGNRIVGRAEVIFWPFSRLGLIRH